MERLSFLPVILIGAPRSGTNMLRNVLCTFNGAATWPCDEINYIWRHGNLRYPSDGIPAACATPGVRSRIRKQFARIAGRYNARVVVEKTCANSLRVPFVNSILPEAKYIFIYRDGLDVAASARLRWTAGLDIPYLLRKVRFVPPVDLPYYGGRYLRSRIYRWFSHEKRLAFWGPALDNMKDILTRYSLNEVCALQWQRCVENAESAFADMPADRVVRIRYEDFVQKPGPELKKVLDFIKINYTDAEVTAAVTGVSSKNIGKGRISLGTEEVLRLEALVGQTLDRYGYRD